MNAAALGAAVFALTIGGVFFGMWLRSVLPAHHVDDASHASIARGVGLVVTMASLVLGFVIASAKSLFDAVDAALKQFAVEVLALDRVLARYGPETDAIRKELRDLIGARIEAVWPRDPAASPDLGPVLTGPVSAAERLADSVRRLHPADDAQRVLEPRALDLTEALLRARWLVIAGTEPAVPVPFLVVLVFWLTVIFGSFGLNAPRNATVIGVLAVCALSVAGAVYLVLELEAPFDGLIKVSAEPMRYAYEHMGQ